MTPKTQNLDMKKQDKALYYPSAKSVSEVDVPAMQFLMMDGAGNPNTEPRYTEAVQTLYTLAYGIRAISKAQGMVYSVMPLEGLWWFEHGAPIDGDESYKEQFIWTLMIRQPDHITPAMLEEARATVAKKKDKQHLPLGDVRLETYHEGYCVQIMHLGPYAEEEPTIARLHQYMADEGYVHRLKHHEIYLNDPRKVAPEKVKTVIRQPVAKA
jgi:hypothetical protein